MGTETKTIKKIKSKAYNQARKASIIANRLSTVFPASLAPNVARNFTAEGWDDIASFLGYNGCSEETRHMVLALLDVRAEAAGAKVTK